MYNLNADQFDTATRYTPSTTEKFAPIRTSDALTALLDSAATGRNNHSNGANDG